MIHANLAVSVYKEKNMSKAELMSPSRKRLSLNFEKMDLVCMAKGKHRLALKVRLDLDENAK